MSPEEAIKIIKSECYVANLMNLDRTIMVNTALDVVVKVIESQLQQRNCESCKHSNNGRCAYTEECHECMWENKYEPQCKHGKWRWELAPNGWANHICSECGFKENTDIHVKLNWQYCPNCGARMIQESGDEKT